MARNKLTLYAFYKSYFLGFWCRVVCLKVADVSEETATLSVVEERENLLPCLVETIPLVYPLQAEACPHYNILFTVDLPIILSSCSVILFQI
jgi:hypothetical protein